MIKLYKHQEEFLAKKSNKDALIWDCGTGKTITSLLWAKEKEELGTLVICPKPLREGWGKEVEKVGIKGVRIYTKEEFKKEWAQRPQVLKQLKQVIIDEAHNGFLTPHFKSQMSKSLRSYIGFVNRVLILTATPYSSSPWNIFNLAFYLGYKWNWQKFNTSFFNQIRMGRRIVPVAKKGSEKVLANMVKKFCSVVSIYDCLDVPDQIHQSPERIDLTTAQQIAIKNNYDPLPIVRYTKQHEIENGILLPDEFSELRVFNSEKNKRIQELVLEHKKIAIVCRYNAQIDVLADLLKEHNPLIIRGDVKDRHAITIQAENSERCVVLIQADCAEGYQLPSFGICVFASMSYSYVKFQQICGRFLRMDKPSKTVFKYLLTSGDSIDKAIYDSILRKETFSIEVYAKNNLDAKKRSAI